MAGRAFLAGLLGRKMPSARRRGGQGTHGRTSSPGTPGTWPRLSGVGRRAHTAGRRTGAGVRAAGRVTRRATAPVRRLAGRATAPARRAAVQAVRRIGRTLNPTRLWKRRILAQGGGPRSTTSRRAHAYARARHTAAHRWQEFLRAHGLDPARNRAAAIARDGWEDFLRGTGLLDPDAGIGDPFGPGAKPITGRPATGALPPPLPPPPGAGDPVPTPGRTSTMTAPGPSSTGNIFQGLIEVAHQTSGSWKPVNANGEAAAQEMRKMVRDIPEVFAALAAMYRTMSGACTDTIAMETGTADMLTGAARYMTGPVAALRENATLMDRPHDDDVRRVQTDNPGLAAWDWQRNQGYPEMH